MDSEESGRHPEAWIEEGFNEIIESTVGNNGGVISFNGPEDDLEELQEHQNEIDAINETNESQYEDRDLRLDGRSLQQDLEDMSTVLKMAKSMRHEALAYTKIGRNALLRDIKNANGQLKSIKHENESLRRELHSLKQHKKQATSNQEELGSKAEKDREIFNSMFQQDKEKYCKQISQLKNQVMQMEHDKLELQKAFAIVQNSYLNSLLTLQAKICEVKLDGVEEALEDEYKNIQGPSSPRRDQNPGAATTTVTENGSKVNDGTASTTNGDTPIISPQNGASQGTLMEVVASASSSTTSTAIVKK